MQIQDHIHRSSLCGGHILYYSRIRKNVTENTQTDREHTENREQRADKAITEATLIVDVSPG